MRQAETLTACVRLAKVMSPLGLLVVGLVLLPSCPYFHSHIPDDHSMVVQGSPLVFMKLFFCEWHGAEDGEDLGHVLGVGRDGLRCYCCESYLVLESVVAGKWFSRKEVPSTLS